MDILNPTVFWAGYEWREPVTSATDFLVAVVAMIALWRLRDAAKTLPMNLMRGYFVCLAAGMASAAILGHLLQAYVPWETKAIGWVFSAIGIMCFEWSSWVQVRKWVPLRGHQLIGLWIVLHHTLFFVAMCFDGTRVFETVKTNSTLGLAFSVLPMQAYLFWKTRSPSSRWLAGAVIFGLAPAMTYNFEISVSRWFNFHDVSHVLMATYVFIVYQGTRRLAMAEAAHHKDTVTDLKQAELTH